MATVLMTIVFHSLGGLLSKKALLRIDLISGVLLTVFGLITLAIVIKREI